MSQSTPTYISFHKRAPYYTSMLSAEATPFSPFDNLPYPTAQRSTLRPSAPIFVAPTASVLAESSNTSVVGSTPEPTTAQHASSTRIDTTRNDDREHYHPLPVSVVTPTVHHAPPTFSTLSNSWLPYHEILDPDAFPLDGMPDFNNDHTDHSTHHNEHLDLDDFLDQHADYFIATTARADPPSTQQDASTHEANNTSDYATGYHDQNFDAALGHEFGLESTALASEHCGIASNSEQFPYQHALMSSAAFDHKFPLDITTPTYEQSGVGIATEEDPFHDNLDSGAGFNQGLPIESISFLNKQSNIDIAAEQSFNYSNIAYTDEDYNNAFRDKSQRNPLTSTHPVTDIVTEQGPDMPSNFSRNTKQSTIHTLYPTMDSPVAPLSDTRPYSPPVTPPEQFARALILGENHVSQNIDYTFDADADTPHERLAGGTTRRNSKKTMSLSAVRNAGVKKSKKKDTATAPSPALQAKARAVSLKASIDHKMRQAGLVIAAQKKSDTPAGKMGQHIQLVRENGRLKPKGVYWKAPVGDDTIPSTEEGKATLVQQLVAAMRNNKGCKEVSGSRQFLNRWGDEAKYFSDEELEIAAWSAVDKMVDVHTNGWTSTIMDSNLRDQLQKTMFCTFEDRFEALVKLLTSSKRTCEDLLKKERFLTIVGNPWELEVRTTSNAASNKAKGAFIKDKKNMKRAREEDEDGGRPQKAARSS